MLLRPGARDNHVLKMFNDYLHFIRVVENTPKGLISRSHEWVRGFHGAIGLHGEAGEIEQLFKKDMFGKNKSVQRIDLVNELGDLLWYFVLLCDAFTISFEELIEFNMAKLAQRYAEKINQEDNRGEYIHLRNQQKQESADAKKVEQDYAMMLAKIVEPFTTYLPEEEQEKLRELVKGAMLNMVFKEHEHRTGMPEHEVPIT